MIETALTPQYVGDEVKEDRGFFSTSIERIPIFKTAYDQIKKLLETSDEEFKIENEHQSKRKAKDEF